MNHPQTCLMGFTPCLDMGLFFLPPLSQAPPPLYFCSHNTTQVSSIPWQDPGSHLPLPSQDEWEPENPVKAMLDSCSCKSSCDIWGLGRRVGLKLRKLLWHPCSQDRWPFSSPGDWSATQADNCESGRDHESRKCPDQGPKALKNMWAKKSVPEDHRPVMPPVLCHHEFPPALISLVGAPEP
jgi:hypothetical protein